MTSGSVYCGWFSGVTLGICLCLLTGDVAAQQSSGPASREPWTTSRLRGTPEPPDPFRILPAFPQLPFDHPTSVVELPGSERLLITQMDGRIFTFPQRSDVAAADLVGDLQALAGGRVSLFSACLHPEFQQNGYLYACLVHPAAGGHTRVSRFTVTREPVPQLQADSELVIITWPSGGHNAGCLQFGPDGLLYIATGDGSGPNPPDGLTTGQDVTDLLGAILRIDVDHPTDNRPYGIPADNPFVSHPTARPEIFGYGLRNPWKFGIDPQTGQVFVADNGWETWEMVHLVQSGTNCGWPIMEGRAQLRTEVAAGPTPITPPLRDHHHSEANSVIGGPVYRGDRLPGLDGFFVYGDYITGTIWAVRAEADGTTTARTLVDTDQRIIAFTETAAGRLLMLDYDRSGQLYEILPSDVPDQSAEFPRRLSETGLFASLSPLQPARGVIPYSVTVPRWMDGATAQRWIAVPGQQQVQLATADAATAEFPDGTVFVKQLSIPAAAQQPARPLETQILLRERGAWLPFSYLWNADGTDATLVPSAGTATQVTWPDAAAPTGTSERTWRTSAVNECRLCHNAGPGFVLGFTRLQLASAQGTTGAAASQLEVLRQQQLLRADMPAATDGSQNSHTASLRLVNPQDTTQSLDDRARSYLHGNCSMCHHRGGNAIVSIFLSRDLTFDQLNTNKGTGIGTFGMQHARIIVPGDPWRSVLMYRMSRLGYARMPYIGSQVVDSQGVALIAAWIQSLSDDRTAETSPPLAAGSPAQQALARLQQPAATAAERQQAVQQLVGSSEGGLALAIALHDGRLSAADRQLAVAATRTAGSDIQGLFDAFVPEAQRRKTLGRVFDPAVVLQLTGDAGRGRTIFFSDASRCRTCHHSQDAAQSVGPTLTEIHRQYAGNAELLQHVLNPSLKVDERFAAWVAVTRDGRIHSGLLDSRTEQQIVLRTADRQRLTLSRSDLEELQKSDRSLMPDGVLADLTAQEAADLLAYIRATATDSAASPEPRPSEGSGPTGQK